MDVSESVILQIQILSEKRVRGQFISTDDGTKDPAFVTDLYINHDETEGHTDYCFSAPFGISHFFLFQFAETKKR